MCPIEYLDLNIWVNLKGGIVPIYLTGNYDHIMGLQINLQNLGQTQLNRYVLLNLIDRAVRKHTATDPLDIRPYIKSIKVCRSAPVEFTSKFQTERYTCWATVVAVLPSMEMVDSFFKAAGKRPREYLEWAGRTLRSDINFTSESELLTPSRERPGKRQDLVPNYKDIVSKISQSPVATQILSQAITRGKDWLTGMSQPAD